jgi:putative transposase
MSQTPHHPPHIYLDDTWYAITASVYGRHRWLVGDVNKTIVRDKLKELVSTFKASLAAWVILDNHYHLLIKAKTGKDISAMIGQLHGFVSHEINKIEGLKRRMWDNYWDICIRDEPGYWTRFNYIHHNPVKHGYVNVMQDWSFSSYKWYVKHKGTEWMADVLARFPVKDFTDARDAF